MQHNSTRYHPYIPTIPSAYPREYAQTSNEHLYFEAAEFMNTGLGSRPELHSSMEIASSLCKVCSKTIACAVRCGLCHANVHTTCSEVSRFSEVRCCYTCTRCVSCLQGKNIGFVCDTCQLRVHPLEPCSVKYDDTEGYGASATCSTCAASKAASTLISNDATVRESGAVRTSLVYGQTSSDVACVDSTNETPKASSKSTASKKATKTMTKASTKATTTTSKKKKEKLGAEKERRKGLDMPDPKIRPGTQQTRIEKEANCYEEELKE
ncbi:hypothetical protein SARC_07513 [Sphaeroforma arctica JP610]|uniref:Uncharacterized protein n=1 Tax=Sphaeroforma arctica JP610 TaxID=667725 RepID=A0A0L0FW11_9EUKA|nr:hypothetical protein SARC_07513 [Sphaeroforma arctica JP610]KNC80113.1 hypothetical protein SARC_07513 [Sphaeroforma arctica JP610]|eukprot:XP_014154015.1 hypothetical protein SARC_07513 [Sphaeroforma arctica JP610]